MQVLFDDDCGLCTQAVRWFEAHAPHVQAEPLRVPSDEIIVVLDDGSQRRGAAGVAVLLRSCEGVWAVVGRLMQLPFLAGVSRVVYRVVAANRAEISRRAGWEQCRLPRRG